MWLDTFQDGEAERVSLGREEDQHKVCGEANGRLPEASERGGQGAEGNRSSQRCRWETCGVYTEA